MTEVRPRVGHVYVEPLGRAVLSGVPEPVEPGDEVPPGGPLRRPLDVGIVPLFSDERPLTGLAAFFDWRASGMLSALVRKQWWSGALGDAVLIPARRTLPVQRIVLFGLGRSQGFDAPRARHAAAAMVTLAERLAPRDVMLAMPGKGQERAIVETVFDAALAALRVGDGAQADGPARPWWVIADPRHVARLRRVLEGPPRAAAGVE